MLNTTTSSVGKWNLVPSAYRAERHQHRQMKVCHFLIGEQAIEKCARLTPSLFEFVCLRSV
jgi:hypothetical protein